MSQNVSINEFEVLVIDNNSSDNTKEVIRGYESRMPNLKYFIEENIGLSYARNKGARHAKYDWLLYIDDDAKLIEGGLKEVLFTIKNYNFAMFTGIWKAWYGTPAPKWFPFDAGNYVVKGEPGIREIGEDNVSGGIMAINKEIFFKEVQSFPIQLGMTGKNIGYGEETYVENLLKEKGYSIGINTNIIIDHFVNESKYNVSWHLKAAYHKGIANCYISENESIINNSIKFVGALLFGWIRPLGKLLIQKHYYRQNFIISFLGGIQYAFARLTHKKEKT